MVCTLCSVRLNLDIFLICADEHADPAELVLKNAGKPFTRLQYEQKECGHTRAYKGTALYAWRARHEGELPAPPCRARRTL